MARLTESEIAEVLKGNPEWRLEGGALVRDLLFDDFAQAMAFVNRVAEVAERQDHHPNIAIRYNGVRLELVSHDVGALTHRDAAIVRRLNALV
jgi:4a-hydroxytetrahydrobiopterin dehydratase